MARVWRTMPGQLLDPRVWDDEGVVYNDLSGDTHLLGAPSLHLLATLGAGSATAGALAAALQDAFEFDAGQDVAAESDALLAELARLHLIERAA